MLIYIFRSCSPRRGVQKLRLPPIFQSDSAGYWV